MTFLGNQRPAAPWSNHNYWGKFDLAANLPNTATSDIQVSTAELQRGDVAWADGPGAGGLYLCIDPTAGSAVWELIDYGGSASLQTRQDFYVDADNGSDANPGTAAEPFATIQRAVDEIPDVVNADHYIHIVEAPVAGAYDPTGLDRIFNLGAGSVIIVGENINVLYSGTVDAGPTNNLIFTDAAQAWTPDELVGRSVRFTSGAGANYYRTIIENTATTFTVAEAFFGAVPGAGDAYEIFSPTVELDFASVSGLVGGAGHTEWASGEPGLPGFDTFEPSPVRTVTYANLIIGSSTTRLTTICEQLCFMGVEVTTSDNFFRANLATGRKAYSGILTMPAAADSPSENFGTGWGAYFSATQPATRLLNGALFHGIVSHGRMGSPFDSGFHLFASGRITGTDGSNIIPLFISPSSTAQLGGRFSSRLNLMLVKPINGAAPIPLGGVVLDAGSSALIGTNFVIDMRGTLSNGLYVNGANFRFNASGAGNEFEAQVDGGVFAYAIRILGGGKFLFDSIDLDQVLVGGSNVAAIGLGPTGAITTATTGAGGDFTADGNFVQAVDQSIAIRDAFAT